MAARRPLLMLLLTMAAGWSFAQAPPKSRTAAAAAATTADVIGDPELEPQVTIVRRDEQVRRGSARQGRVALRARHAAPRPAVFPDSGRQRRNLHPARQSRFVAESADVGPVLVLIA